MTSSASAFKSIPNLGRRLYASLFHHSGVPSVLSLLLAGGCTFCAYQTGLGDERFHRKWVIPTIHRFFTAENAHIIGVKLAKHGFLLANFEQNQKEYPVLRCTMFGKQLKNPIGLAAGFDKNGEAIDGLRSAGFGFIEIGSVTPRPQLGNERPRVFRLPEDEAVINSYGFNSDGIGAVLDRVKKAFTPNCAVPLGVNLGKNKETVEAVNDFQMGINEFSPYCDYLVVNVSSPNTLGLRKLQAKKELKTLLVALRETLNQKQQKFAASGDDQSKQHLPHLLVKISPDLSKEQMAEIAEVCTDRDVTVDGLIVTNTTMQRFDTLKNAFANRRGGLSGKPLHDLSTQCIAEMYRLTCGKIPIIGCGGIASGADAYDKIKAGASVVQLYTALVYQGFPVVGRVKRELAQLVENDGYANVAEAVGAQHRKK